MKDNTGLSLICINKEEISFIKGSNRKIKNNKKKRAPEEREKTEF